jgi:hypothetical protein
MGQARTHAPRQFVITAIEAVTERNFAPQKESELSRQSPTATLQRMMDRRVEMAFNRRSFLVKLRGCSEQY